MACLPAGRHVGWGMACATGATSRRCPAPPRPTLLPNPCAPLPPTARPPACLQGLLQFMGPFLTPEGHDCGDGMFCLRAASTAEAVAIVDQNPFHQRGIRTYIIRPWLEKVPD